MFATTLPASSLLWPLFVQVLLTFAVVIQLGRARSQALRARQTSRADTSLALGKFEWSEAATKASNNFSNQFEIPVLFYAAIAVALLLKQWDLWLVALAWVFALTRIAHAIVHLGPNSVPVRALCYLAGVAALLVFWITLMVRVASGAAII